MIRLMKWLFGGRAPDLDALLRRTDAEIVIERANGDRVVVTPLGSQRPPKTHPQGGRQSQQQPDRSSGRPNGPDTGRPDGRLFGR